MQILVVSKYSTLNGMLRYRRNQPYDRRMRGEPAILPFPAVLVTLPARRG